jgi:alpha-tubulin suppressor-like RCC1 family protein
VAGYSHSLVLMNDTNVFAFGNNQVHHISCNYSTDSSDLGAANRLISTLISSLSGVIRIGTGDTFSLIIKNDLKVYAFGDNSVILPYTSHLVGTTRNE